MLPTSSRSVTIRNGLLLLLACAAGAIDAISYLGLGRVFTANMTGNTVLLGLALVQADHQEALRASLALVGFLGGGALGAWVVEKGSAAGLWPRTVTVALALEWGFLVVFAVGWLYTGGEAATFAARGLPDRALGAGHGGAKRRRPPARGLGDCDHVYHGNRDDAGGMAHAMARWGRRNRFHATAGGHDRLRQRPDRRGGRWDCWRPCGGCTLEGRWWLVHVCALGPELAVLFPLALMLDRDGHRGGSLAAVI